MLLAPLPALGLGVLVMQRSGVSPTIWGQQVVAGLVLLIVCAGMAIARRPASQFRLRVLAIVAGAALLLLMATLAPSGVEGVRRWVSLGPLQLHAAFVVLPILLIVLCAIVERESLGAATWVFPVVAGIAAIVLVLQPDASQATAFAVAIGLILLQRRRANVSDWIGGGVLVGAAVLAWLRPDPLEIVPHVEGIVGLAASLSAAWQVASIVALVLIPLPFISSALRHREQRLEAFSLAAYYGVVCVAPFAGPYPVPILGYGLSPILGYFAVLGWIILRDGAAIAETGCPTTLHTNR
jgi:cell division protein FtsW (lipid II flippase)